MQAIRTMIEEECIPSQPFPLLTMSTEELESCATRAFRIHAGFLQNRLSHSSPQRFRLNYDDDDAEWVTANEITCGPYLIPGGRWMLTLAGKSEGPVHFALFCWDLASVLGAHEAIAVLRPVAMLPLSAWAGVPSSIIGLRSLTVQSAAPDGINILICSSDDGLEDGCVALHDFLSE